METQRSFESRLHALAYVLVLLWMAGCQPEPAYLTAESAGPDFSIQGEYLGTIENATTPGQPVGAQVIALGEGKFRAVLLPGGLPGAGWDGTNRWELNGVRATNRVEFQGSGALRAVVADQVMSGQTGPGTPFRLHPTPRQSPTLNAAPPPRATVLFNGSTTEAWLDGQMTEDGYLAVGARGIPEFSDFTLHLEFRIPFQPTGRGQARGNSGVYLQDRYEIQVLDSFGLEPDKDGCGAIYDLAAPRINACFPPLSWQTYDVKFTAARFDNAGKKIKDARVTVKHNGLLIHQDQIISKPTGGGKRERPRPGGLRLQDHGSPVVYRNIWVVRDDSMDDNPSARP